MPCSPQDSTAFRFQGEDVPGFPQLFRFRFRINQSPDRFKPIMGGNPGGAPVADEIDGNSKWRLKGCCINTYHEIQTKFLTTVFNQGGADQAPRMSRHEIDDLGCNAFCGANKIALVFTIFIIHHNDDLTVLDLFDRLFYSVEDYFAIAHG